MEKLNELLDWRLMWCAIGVISGIIAMIPWMLLMIRCHKREIDKVKDEHAEEMAGQEQEHMQVMRKYERELNIQFNCLSNQKDNLRSELRSAKDENRKIALRHSMDLTGVYNVYQAKEIYKFLIGKS